MFNHSTNALWTQAVVEHRRGAFDESIRSYERLLKLIPDVEGARCDFAIALSAADQLDRAEAEYREVLRRSPSYSKAVYGLITVLLKRGDIEEASRQLEYLGGIEPSNPRHHAVRGTILRYRGLDAEAASEFRRALEGDPENVGAHFGMGLVEMKRERWADALREFDRGLRCSPGDVSLLYQRGCALLKMGKGGAASEFQRILARRPNHFPAAQMLGVALFERATSSRRYDDLESARAALERAVRLKPDDALAHYLLAAVTWLLGEREVAIREARAALAVDPRHALARAALRRMLFWSGRWREAWNLRKAYPLANAPGDPPTNQDDATNPETCRNNGGKP